MWVVGRARHLIIAKQSRWIDGKCSVPIHTGSSIVTLLGNDPEERAGATVKDTVTTRSVERIPLEGDVAVWELGVAEDVLSMELGGRADQYTGNVEIQGLIVEQL
jgi:hypothetical protein